MRRSERTQGESLTVVGRDGRGRDRERVRRLAAARVVSAGGSQAAQVALVYQIYATTDSSAWVAAALFASMGISGLLSPLSGLVADRFDRRRVMVLSELAGAAAYAALVLAHSPALLVAGTLAATAFGAPFRAASAAAIPNVVHPDDRGWANGMLATAFNVAQVGGPFLGGALVAASGAEAVFAVNAMSFVISAIVIGRTSGAFGGRNALDANDRTRALLAGFHVLATNPKLAPLAASSALAFASFGVALVIDPALAQAFDAGSVGYGLLTAVWGGGAVIGAIIAGRTVTVARAPAAVVWGMAAMAVSLGSIVVLPTFALIVVAGAIGGVGSGFAFVPWLLLIQHHTADAARGRVVAATEACDQIAFLIGVGVASPVVAMTGPQHAYGLAGLLLAAAVLCALAAVNKRAPVAEPMA
jgi:MFS family permease